MTYLPRTRSKSALGGVSDVIGSVVSAAAQVAGMANDPYAQELVCRIRQVAAVELGTSVPPCPSVPITTASPAGLRKPVVGMRAYVWAEQRKPWSYPTVIAAAVGIPFLLGYLVGRK